MSNLNTVATTIRNLFDDATAPTLTPVTLPGGVKLRLVGQAEGFNAEDVAELALAQEDAVKVMRPASEDESDIVANGGRVSVSKTFGGEAGGKLEALAAIIRAASGVKPIKPVKVKARGTSIPAPGTTSPASNGATP